MDAGKIASLKTALRHETGHLIVGKSLSFPTGVVVFNDSHAGQEVFLTPKIKSIADLIQFTEKRIIALYGGVLAQSLKGQVADRQGAEKLLTTSAADDFSKIRELVRLLAGAKFPEADEEEFKSRLEETRKRLFESSAEIVESNAAVIIETSDFLMREAIAMNNKQREQSTKEIGKTAIDNFLAGKTIK